MTEPLSIAASIAGIIAISAKIVSMLKNIHDCGMRAKQVPQSINRLMEEMQAMNVIFSQVQLFILGAINAPSPSRLKILSIHHLVTTLTGCVLICSNLDKYLTEMVGISDLSCPQPPANKTNLLSERIKWALWKEAEVAVFIEDLQRHKLSLNLMLGIIHCNTTAQACDSVAKLHETVGKILKSNHAISTQLQELISRNNPPISDEIEFSAVDIQPKATSTRLQVPDNNDDAASIRTASLSRSTLSSRSMRFVLPSFTDALKNSRPYKRIQNCGMSGDSNSTLSRTGGCGWSILSNMSLGDLSISELSVVQLPICLSDLWDSQPYQVQFPLPSAAGRHSSHRKLKLKWSSWGHIHRAIREGNENVIRTLLFLGIDIEESDSKGRTPLAYAAYMRRESICRLLLKRGASIEAITSIISLTDLTGCINMAVKEGSETVVRLLLVMGVDIEERCWFGMTPLLRALYHCQRAIARFLIGKGADLFARDNDQWTAVHCAMKGGDPEALTEILEQGAWEIIDQRDRAGHTPLHGSIRSLTLTKILVEHGASLNIKDKDGETPYQMALRFGRHRETPYQGALSSSCRDVAKYLWSQLSPEEQALQAPPPVEWH